MQRSFIFCLSLLCGLPLSLQAQTQSSVPTVTIAAALAKQVHLSSDLTLRQAMQSLSEQMGVQIQLADYLADRRLTAKLDHVTARDALDALAELEDWQWIEATPHRIRIERLPTPAPKETVYIPRRLQAELPRDLRDFFKLPRPDDDLKKYHWAVLDKENSVSQDMGRGIRLFVEQQRLTIEGHLPALQAGKKIYFTDLTPSEKEHLLLGLTVQAIRRSGNIFWKGDLPPYVADPFSSILELNSSNNLFIGTHIDLENGTASAGIGTRLK